jgi:hypothetical protein
MRSSSSSTALPPPPRPDSPTAGPLLAQVVWQWQRMSLGLLLEPLQEYEQQLAARAIPDPMYKGAPPAAAAATPLQQAHPCTPPSL